MFEMPKSLGAIAKVCDRKESTRFALQNVHVKADEKSGDVVVSATDSKSLIVATLSTNNADAIMPMMIDGEDWLVMFNIAKSQVHRYVADESVAVESHCQFRIGDKLIQLKDSGGKFPPTDNILKTTRSKPPGLSIRVDPILLARQLLAMAEVCDLESPCQATIEFRGSENPIVCEMKGENIQTVGLLMPCSK